MIFLEFNRQVLVDGFKEKIKIFKDMFIIGKRLIIENSNLNRLDSKSWSCLKFVK